MNTIKLIFASLFKNDAAIEGRKKSWLIALIIFLFSTIVAVIPLTVATANTNGSSFFGSTLYSFDIGLQKFNQALDDNNIDLTVAANLDSEHILVTTGDPSVMYQGTDTFYRYNNPVSDQTIIKVYFKTESTVTETTDFVTALLALTNTSTAPGDISSFIVFGSHAMYAYLYNPAGVADFSVAGSNYATGFQGNFTAIEPGTNLRNFIKYDANGDAFDVTTAAGQTKFMNNWKSFFDKSYSQIKQTLLWSSTGIMIGVDAIIGIFMILMIFILTRGKSNPNHTFSILDAFKIGSWSMLSPALIALILGFIFTSYASMIFIMTMGLRIMWMSMKNLRPMPTGPAPVKK
ncbi:MAG: hypothetical protein NTV44_05845 [Firmicutes bacterium]|nr:hypothetical protein [Bacillota bacterium]